MEAFEYAVRKDIRNNPIVREVDEARQREMWRTAAVGALLVILVLAWAWQHFELIRYGYRLESMQAKREAEEQINRNLRLEIESLQAPQRIESLARRELKLEYPAEDEAFVLERVAPSGPPALSVVARAGR